MISKSAEEYLKNIYLIFMQSGNVRVTDIANKMQCTKPSVNKALHILKDEGLISYEPYSEIVLTEEGKEYAKKIIAAYDIVFLFLREILGIKTDEAKQEADKIKAAMSDDTLNQLARYVHKELNLIDLICAYDLNKEKCRTCANIKKNNTEKNN